ncbi:hypothetical protein RB195_004603 [Necator americanus]|uniref:Peptidase A2 domain-containing protein n=1 Tax=Necator americanus TaxID=51031 RepID=A0ABR1BMR9_NECAM
MYCKNNHPSYSCTQYSTPQDRSAYLHKEQLCMICASPKHRTTECKGRPCFNCKGLHHTSCCFKNNTESRPSQYKGNNPTNIARLQEKVKERINKGSSKMVRSNVIATSDNTTSETSILQLQTILSTSTNSKEEKRPYLPTGEVTIMDPETKSLSKVDVLLDTGAEISFVDSTLAAKLHLPVIEERRINLHTAQSSVRKIPKNGDANSSEWKYGMRKELLI